MGVGVGGQDYTSCHVGGIGEGSHEEVDQGGLSPPPTCPPAPCPPAPCPGPAPGDGTSSKYGCCITSTTRRLREEMETGREERELGRRGEGLGWGGGVGARVGCIVSFRFGLRFGLGFGLGWGLAGPLGVGAGPGGTQGGSAAWHAQGAASTDPPEPRRCVGSGLRRPCDGGQGGQQRQRCR